MAMDQARGNSASTDSRRIGRPDHAIGKGEHPHSICGPDGVRGACRVSGARAASVRDGLSEAR